MTRTYIYKTKVFPPKSTFNGKVGSSAAMAYERDDAAIGEFFAATLNQWKLVAFSESVEAGLCLPFTVRVSAVFVAYDD